MDQAEAWEAAHKRRPWVNVPNQDFLSFMAYTYWGQSGLNFLDLGCGTGAYTLFLAERDFFVTAVDISKTACDKLREHLEEKGNGVNVQIIHAAISDIKIESESFDCVIIGNLLDCIAKEECIPILKAVKRWLKPEGKLFIRVMNHDLPEVVSHEGVTIRPFTPEDLIELMHQDYTGGITYTTGYMAEGTPVTNLVTVATIRPNE